MEGQARNGAAQQELCARSGLVERAVPDQGVHRPPQRPRQGARDIVRPWPDLSPPNTLLAAIGGPPTHYLPRLLQILDQVVKKIPGFSHEVNYFLRRETETGTFDEATTLGDIDNLEFQMVLPAAPDEAAGKRKLADLESRLKKAEEALAEARAAKKPARPAAAKATA